MASAAGVVGYTIGIEPHWLEIVERNLAIDNLPSALEGARLAQISDLHMGPQVSDDYLVQSFDRVRAFAPDVVVCTGDFITHRASRRDAQYRQLRAVLASYPQGRLATVGILGNHDYGHGWGDPSIAARVVSEAERAGVRILRNEVLAVSGLDIIGIDDLWARRGDPVVALSARESGAGLVLVHNPDAADEELWPGYRGSMLAGHTHGGQCEAPISAATIVAGEESTLRARRSVRECGANALHQPRRRTSDPRALRRAAGDYDLHTALGCSRVVVRSRQ